MLRADMLSQNRTAGLVKWTWRSLNSVTSQVISQVTCVMALYSASAEDRETVVCFFDFQEMRESPRKMQ